MSKKVLVIVYVPLSGGQFLEYFLMNHPEVFYKGQTTIDCNNEYWNIRENDNYFNSAHFLKQVNADFVLDVINHVDNITEDTIENGNRIYKVAEHKYITVSPPPFVIDKKNINVKNGVLLGIYIGDAIPYITSLVKLKRNGYNDRSISEYERRLLGNEKLVNTQSCYGLHPQPFYDYYETPDILKGIPAYFINYKQFFIEQNVDEYIALCTFLDIKPNVEMYIKAVGYYMFMNNNLLANI